MPVQCTCVGCGRAFSVPPSLSQRKWCSAACRYATPGWQGVLHPNSRRECVCAICGATFTVTSSRIGRYCSRKCLGIANGRRQTKDPAKWQAYTCAECGTTFEGLICVAYRKRFCSKRCRTMWRNHRMHVARPTSIEVALGAAMDAIGIHAEREYRVGRFSVDFALTGRRIAIEADGDYWHSLAKQQRADARKDAYLTAAGWTVVRFTETQIVADAAACAATVAALL